MARWVPVRCRIPELLKRIGKTQRWLANKTKISEQNLSDYSHMRNGLMPGLPNAKTISEALNCSCIDDLHEWKDTGIGGE